MSLARAGLPDVSAGELGFNGTTNVLDVIDSDSDLLDRLLALIEDVLRIFLTSLAEACAAGEVRVGELWLKAAEACLDVPTTDSVSEVRLAQRAMLIGATEMVAHSYRRGAVDEAGIPAVTFKVTSTGPALKVYAKRRDICRLEVACQDRAAVNKLTGRVREEPIAKGARRLVVAALAAAAPSLRDLKAHLDEVKNEHENPVELILELNELIAMAAGRPTRGAPTKPSTTQAARDALDSLLLSGWYHARGQAFNNGLPTLLRKMAESGTLLKRHPRKQVFYMAPASARARWGIEQVLSMADEPEA